jgi:hypothetical protein
MLDDLEREWNMSLSWADCAALCERMTEAREKLKRERGIKSPTMRCHDWEANQSPANGPDAGLNQVALGHVNRAEHPLLK